MARYLKLKNQETGAECVIDTYLSRYKKLAQGFLNTLREDRRFMKFITLTQGVESYRPKMINNFMNKLRNHYGDIVYFWAVEVQVERFEKTGEAVLHWHIMMGFPWDIQFGKEDVMFLQKAWGYGDPRNSVDIRPVYSKLPSLTYLMKYVTKALGSPLEIKYKIHRVGSSKVEPWLRQSFLRVCDAIDYVKNYLLTELEYFFWDYRGAYVWKDLDEPITLPKDMKGKHWKQIRVIRRRKDYFYTYPPSGWFKLMESDKFDEMEVVPF